MASIDDTPHGEQEVEEGEWETVWEPADPLQEIFRTQKRISDAPQILLDNMARMQANAQIEPPILAMLRRAEQNAAAAMPAWLENLNRTEEMLKRAQGLRPVQRRKQRANMSVDRQLPERPSTPPCRLRVRMHAKPWKARRPRSTSVATPPCVRSSTKRNLTSICASTSQRCVPCLHNYSSFAISIKRSM